MTLMRRFLAPALLLLAAAPPVGASEYNGRSYSLHTLDYRVAETLIWEICDANGGKSERCRVQAASPGGINVYASQEVHAQIVAMLAERDRTIPASLLFEIALVKLIDNGHEPSGDELAAHHRRALEAVWEIFPGKRAEIFDTGLIRTATEGQTQLADAQGDVYTAFLDVVSMVGGADGLVFTVDLAIGHGATKVLGSSLSIAEGETVVAGSSRPDGETAFVVLVTSQASG